jgi:hypothetical protein
VVFGFDNAIRGAAFAGDVAGKKEVLVIVQRVWVVLVGVQIDEFAAFVLHGGLLCVWRGLTGFEVGCAVAVVR